MKLDQDQIVQRVHREFDNSLGAPGGDISEERGRAYDYYMRKLFGNEQEGESAVVTSDVADVIDGTMPSLLRIFTTGDNLLTFDPVGPEDEEQANQASDYVNYVFFKRNQSFMLMFYWMFDALLQKNGYVQAYWDESEEVTTEPYEGLTLDELTDLLEDPELEPVERDEQIVQLSDPMTGELVTETLYDVKFRRTTKSGRIKVENVPPDEMRISVDACSPELIKVRMVGRERYVTRDFLLSVFADDPKVKAIIKDLTPDSPSIDSEEKRARYDKSDDQKITTPVDSNDKSQDQFRLRVAYMDIDVDGDERAEYKEVWTVDNTFLYMDDADRHPYHSLCPHPLPHKHNGMAAAEKAMDNQLITSTLLRQILNNLYQTNNPGTHVWEKALGEHTMSDLLTRKVGRVARWKRPPSESVVPDTVPFTAGDSFTMLEYFDRKKLERTGVSADGEGLTPEALKHIQKSVLEGAADPAKAKIETIARVFAETGFKTLFLHLHELVLKHQDKKDIIRLRGKWVPVDPTQWRHRKDMTVQVGLGVGTREQNRAVLDAIAGFQVMVKNEFGMGGLVVTPDNVFNTAQEMVKNANYKDPTLFFTDPEGQQAPPPPEEQAQLQQQAQALQEYEKQLEQRTQALEKKEIQLSIKEADQKHEREMFKLEEEREKRLDEASYKDQQIRNALTEMGIKVNSEQEQQAVKALLGQAQAADYFARAREADARAAALQQDNTVDEARKTAESDAKVRKTDAEIENLAEQRKKLREEIKNLQAERKAIEVEIQAAESGINEMLGDGGETEGSE